MPTEFKIRGLKRWVKALDARGFDAASRRHMRRATELNGKVAEKIQRQTIQSGKSLQKNAALTQAIKGADKPAVDTGLLFQSITSKVIDDFTVVVGVLRTSEAYNIAVIVHEGAKVKVTPKMRGMFYALWKASKGELDPGKLTGRAKELFARQPDGWLPLDADTEVIIIPGRPWAEIAFRNTQMIKQTRDNWKLALEAAFRERSRG